MLIAGALAAGLLLYVPFLFGWRGKVSWPPLIRHPLCPTLALVALAHGQGSSPRPRPASPWQAAAPSRLPSVDADGTPCMLPAEAYGRLGGGDEGAGPPPFTLADPGQVRAGAALLLGTTRVEELRNIAC